MSSIRVMHIKCLQNTHFLTSLHLACFLISPLKRLISVEVIMSFRTNDKISKYVLRSNVTVKRVITHWFYPKENETLQIWTVRHVIYFISAKCFTHILYRCLTPSYDNASSVTKWFVIDKCCSDVFIKAFRSIESLRHKHYHHDINMKYVNISMQ